MAATPDPSTLSPAYRSWTMAPTLLSIEGTLTGCALLTVLLRMYVRLLMLKAFGLDDGLMVAATICAISVLVCWTQEVKYGLGRHALALDWTGPGVVQLFRWLYIYSIMVVLAVSFVKLSIGFFLLRLADRTTFKRFIIGTIIFMTLFTIGCVLAIVFQCIPVQASWNFVLRLDPKTKCYSIETFKKVGVFNSAINIATDLLYASLPVPLLWNLQVNRRTKVTLVVILGLGFFASVAAIIKTPLQYHFFENTDSTGKGSAYYIWQIVEMNIGIMAANLPTLKPLFTHVLQSARAMTSGSGSGSGEHHRNGRVYFGNSARNGRSRGRDGLKQHDDLIALSELSSSASRGRSGSAAGARGPYAVNITSGGGGGGGGSGDSSINNNLSRSQSHHLSYHPHLYHNRLSNREQGIGSEHDLEGDGGRESDDSILPLSRPPPTDGIIRTTEVTIS